MNSKNKSYPVLQAQLSSKHRELAPALLYAAGISTFEEKRKRQGLFLTAEIPAKVKTQGLIEKIRKLESMLNQQKVFSSLKIAKIKKGSWAHDYQESLRPFCLIKTRQGTKTQEVKIDPRGKIPKQLDPNTLYIKASLAFGTGTHATTQLASILLSEALMLKPKTQVLDLGCGTAILGMLAERLGAKKIIAVDNDPEALEIAQENLDINHMKKIKLKSNFKGLHKKFPIIVANITLNVLLELKNEIFSRLEKNGYLVLSGLLYRDCPELLKNYRQLKLIKRMNRKGWAALLLQN